MLWWTVLYFPLWACMRFFSRKYIFRSTCNTGRGTLIWWSVTREASRTEWLHWSIPWQCLKNPRFPCSQWYLVFFSFLTFVNILSLKKYLVVLVCFSNNRWTCFLIWSLVSSCRKWLYIIVIFSFLFFIYFLGGLFPSLSLSVQIYYRLIAESQHEEVRAL